ncbi:MAG TPA: hypothetical protein VHM67_13095, partial [Gemmatimonadaceae bacterium]|nr:hypothetical protein [Gemmatimonadaceae bacterium]
RRDRYHQPADEYDPATWRFDGMVQDVTALQRVGAELASSRAWPNYRPRPSSARSATPAPRGGDRT